MTDPTKQLICAILAALTGAALGAFFYVTGPNDPAAIILFWITLPALLLTALLILTEN